MLIMKILLQLHILEEAQEVRKQGIDEVIARVSAF